MSAEPDPLLARIHAALQRDHVYLDPTLASKVTPAQLKAIEHNVASAKQPLFVVAYPFRDGDRFGGDPQDLVTQLTQAYPARGVYLTTEQQYVSSIFESGVDGAAVRTPGFGDLQISELQSIVGDRHSLGTSLQQATGLAARGPAAIDRADRATDRTSTRPGAGGGSDDAGSTGHGSAVAIGVLSTLLAVVLLTVIGVTIRRRRDRRQRQALTLPRSALDHLRAAHDRRLEQQAREERLTLGERIDAADLDTSGRRAGATTASWQAALDRYDASGRVLARADPPDVLDVVGALVLLRQGASALDAALARQPWSPATTCYLDPLHPRASVQTVVEGAAGAAGGGRRREVPLCRDCKGDLDAGRRPDILDVERLGRAVHYFDSGVEPWASTGYGCFGDDLVVALNRDP